MDEEEKKEIEDLFKDMEPIIKIMDKATSQEALMLGFVNITNITQIQIKTLELILIKKGIVTEKELVEIRKEAEKICNEHSEFIHKIGQGV